MGQLTKEYLLLFNAISDAQIALEQLRADLISAQRQAEDLFIQDEAST